MVDLPLLSQATGFEKAIVVSFHSVTASKIGKSFWNSKVDLSPSQQQLWWFYFVKGGGSAQGSRGGIRWKELKRKRRSFEHMWAGVTNCRTSPMPCRKRGKTEKNSFYFLWELSFCVEIISFWTLFLLKLKQMLKELFCNFHFGHFPFGRFLFICIICL